MSEDQIIDLLEKISNRAPKFIAERAIEALYLEFNPILRNYIWKKMTKDEACLEEAIQDTFFEVWKHPERFRGDSTFIVWLIGIARYKTLDWLRKVKIEDEDVGDYLEVIENHEKTPVELIDEEQILFAIKSCLETLTKNGKLSDAQREVLYLVLIQELNLNEIVNIIGCPEGTIKTRLLNARLRVKNCLYKRLYGGTFHG